MKKQYVPTPLRRQPRPPRHYSLVHELMASPTEPLPASHRTHQLTRMWQGLASLERDPVPSQDDWRVCADAVNLVETLVLHLQVAQDPSGLLQCAVNALASAGRRHQSGQPLRLDAPGIMAVRAVLESYADLIDALPARTMIHAHRLTEKRISEILASKRQAHDVEVVDL